jgi:hypothetical protein
MKTTTLILMMLFAASMINTHAQTATATIENLGACDSTEVFVPVNIEDFLSVGAITMYIGFDTIGLKDVSVENINSQFGGLLFNVFYEPEPQIGISWADVNGANVVSGKLFDIKLFYTSGTSSLVFLDGCEITDTDMGNIPVAFTNGMVFPSIKITQQPTSLTVTEPSEAIFSIGNQGGEFYQWQMSTDDGLSFLNLENEGIFQGIDTHELTISPTSTELNNNLFRCEISNALCLLISDQVMLNVLPGLQTQTADFHKGWNSFSTYLLPEINDFEEIFAPIINSIEIISDGTGIFSPSSGENTIGDFDPMKGYVLKMNEGQTFQLSGNSNENASLQIPPGWSYLPILSSCDFDVETLFGIHMDKVEIIQELPGLNMLWPLHNIATINDLESGKTYLIKTSSSFGITFPPCH